MASSRSIPAVSPNAGRTRWASNGSGVATGARWTTARSACSWATSRVTTMPCSTSACLCPRSGHRTSNDARPCHVPLEVRYQTRQAQCLERLDTWGDQVPHGWVTGDDELGRHTPFRHALRERGERYVLGVPCNVSSPPILEKGKHFPRVMYIHALL